MAGPTSIRLARSAFADSDIAGRVVDFLTGLPVAGARVSLQSGAVVATTEQDGTFTLSVAPGVYAIGVDQPGYASALDLSVSVDGSPTFLEIDLMPASPSPAQSEAIVERLAARSQSPGVPLPDAQAMVRAASGESAAAITVPTTITVKLPASSNDGCGSVLQTMALEDFVKGVVPAEIGGSAPFEALKAQAVAARSYAVWNYNMVGYVYGSTCGEYYNPSFQTVQSNAAVDATAGQVMVWNEGVIDALFFARCNGSTRNSENAIDWQSCQQYSGWHVVSYLRAQQCSGHAPYMNICPAGTPASNVGYYGHGVGLCQIGAIGFANQGWSYQQILTHFYTGVGIVTATQVQPPPPTATPLPTIPPQPAPATPTPLGPSLVPANAPFTIWWTAVTGSSVVYAAQIFRNGDTAPLLTVGPQPGTSWQVSPLPAGDYSWRVVAGSGSQSSPWSPFYPLAVRSNLRQSFLPTI